MCVCVCAMVTTYLEKLELLGNLSSVKELTKCQESVRKKYIANFTFGASPL